MGRLTCNLHHPGMTVLHRAGLAGLYMTLDAFEHDPAALAELRRVGVTWVLGDTEVIIDFPDGRVADGFEALLGLAFGVDQGFFRLAGLERTAKATTEQRFLLYQALLGSFLQFGPHRSLGPKRALLFDVDDKTLRLPGFAPVERYRHQQASRDFLTSKGVLRDCVEVIGWLYPGGSKRHAAWGQSSLEEPAALAFCLLFAAVGAVYFRIASRRRGRKAVTALVLPTVANLKHYADFRRAIAVHGVLALSAASPTDAALQVAVMARASELAEYLAGPIRVIALGIVPWSTQQKSRTAACTVVPEQLPRFEQYELACKLLPNRWQTVKARTDKAGRVKEPEHHFVLPCTARELVADNIASQRTWYAGFAEYMSDEQTRISLRFERKELHQMVRQVKYDDPDEQVFITTCHEAWRRRLGQLGERARHEGISFKKLAGGEYERLRVALSRSKTPAAVRAVVTDFWSRAGSLPSLHTGWNRILPLFEEKQWRKARDLALLALASYQPDNADEEQAPMEDNDIHQEGSEE